MTKSTSRQEQLTAHAPTRAVAACCKRPTLTWVLSPTFFFSLPQLFHRVFCSRYRTRLKFSFRNIWSYINTVLIYQLHMMLYQIPVYIFCNLTCDSKIFYIFSNNSFKEFSKNMIIISMAFQYLNSEDVNPIEPICQSNIVISTYGILFLLLFL